MSRRERAVKRKEIEQDYSAFNRDEDRSIAHAYRRAREIGGEFGGGLDPRRRQEVADGGLNAASKAAAARAAQRAAQAASTQPATTQASP